MEHAELFLGEGIVRPLERVQLLEKLWNERYCQLASILHIDQ